MSDESENFPISYSEILDKLDDFIDETPDDVLHDLPTDDYLMFVDELPDEYKPYAEYFFVELNKTDDLSENVTPLTQSQRIRRGQIMKRYAGKMKMARERAKRRRSSPEKIMQKARKRALDFFRRKFSKGKNYADMSVSEKIAVDKRLAKISNKAIDRIARKQIPFIKQMEAGRIASLNVGTGVVSGQQGAPLAPKNESILPKKLHFQLISKNGIVKHDGRLKINKQNTNKLIKETETFLEGMSMDNTLSMIDRDKKSAAIRYKNMINTAREADKRASEIKHEEVDPLKRLDGTKSLVKAYKSDTPGQVSEADIQLPSKEETLGLDRRHMPQINAENMTDFFKYLSGKNIKTSNELIKPSELTATQHQFNKDKLSSIANDISQKPSKSRIIISKDNYVMDGHHRWLAHKYLGKDIGVVRVDTDVDNLFDIMHDYPKSFTKKLKESWIILEDVSEITPIQLKSFEKMIDELFKKFGIDFEFTKHFADRMNDPRNAPNITIKELAELVKKIYAKKGNPLKDKIGSEIVIKDTQSDINIPVKVEYDRKNDEIDIVAKTIMRKPDFKSKDPTASY